MKKLKQLLMLMMLLTVGVINAQMVLEYDIIEAGTEIGLPLNGDVDVIVDWGDGSIDTCTTVGNKKHNYATIGIKQVIITGSLTEYGDFYNSIGNARLAKVLSWDNLGITSFEYAFHKASILEEVPSELPSTVVSLRWMFHDATSFNQFLDWNVINVTDMLGLFEGAITFNQPLDWDVSNVITMSRMFQDAISFNQPLDWDVSQLENTVSMFSGATAFNQSLASWDIDSILYMSFMFTGATLCIENYDETIISWASQLVGSNVILNFNGGNSKYSEVSASERMTLDKNGWTDSGLDTDGTNACLEVTEGMVLEFDIESANTEIGLPLNINGTIDIIVDWGDGSIESFDSRSDKLHTYMTSGTKIVTITGVLTAFGGFGDGLSRLTKVHSWDGLGLTNLSDAFRGAEELIQVPSELPSTVTFLRSMFTGATSFNQKLDWDVSNVTNMQSMFGGATSFNQKLDWDVSQVETMRSMFAGATSFNQPLDWDVTKVIDMSSMFQGATAFNKPVTFREISGVLVMHSMFNDATSFNQPLDWDVSKVENMQSMFQGATAFNQLLEWNVESVTSMIHMFNSATSFNQSLASWDIENVTSMQNMFTGATLCTENYDATLISWASQLENSTIALNFDGGFSKYSDASTTERASLDKNIWTDSGEDTDGSNACERKGMVLEYDIIEVGTEIGLPLNDDVEVSVDWGDGSVEGPIMSRGIIKHTYSTIGTKRVTITGFVKRFGEIGYKGSGRLKKVLSWDGLGITSFSYAFSSEFILEEVPDELPSTVTDLNYMFTQAIIFNQPLASWDVSNVTDMSGMFSNANSFNQPLNSWDVSNVTDISGMFLHAWAFDQPLDLWDVSSVTNMSSAFVAANVFNRPLNSWDVSKVIDMSGMFASAERFNQPLNTWDVSSVASMNGMFSTTSFNHPLNSWDVSNVTDMYRMFYKANVFDQSLASWDVSSVKNMGWMFDKASSFDQPLNAWDVSNVTDMSQMFFTASNFNQPLDLWDVSSVTTMRSMFRQASSFNQSLDSWNISSVRDMPDMFREAIEFNQSLASWDIGSSVMDMTRMFLGATLCIENYDATLISWSSQLASSTTTLNFDGGFSKYSTASTTERATLDKNGWSDAGLYADGDGDFYYCDKEALEIVVDIEEGFTCAKSRLVSFDFSREDDAQVESDFFEIRIPNELKIKTGSEVPYVFTSSALDGDATIYGWENINLNNAVQFEIEIADPNQLELLTELTILTQRTTTMVCGLNDQTCEFESTTGDGSKAIEFSISDLDFEIENSELEPLCIGAPVLLRAKDVVGIEPFQYEWSTGDIWEKTYTNIAVANQKFDLTITDGNGCDITKTYTILNK